MWADSAHKRAWPSLDSNLRLLFTTLIWKIALDSAFSMPAEMKPVATKLLLMWPPEIYCGIADRPLVFLVTGGNGMDRYCLDRKWSSLAPLSL